MSKCKYLKRMELLNNVKKKKKKKKLDFRYLRKTGLSFSNDLTDTERIEISTFLDASNDTGH